MPGWEKGGDDYDNNHQHRHHNVEKSRSAPDLSEQEALLCAYDGKVLNCHHCHDYRHTQLSYEYHDRHHGHSQLDHDEDHHQSASGCKGALPEAYIDWVVERGGYMADELRCNGDHQGHDDHKYDGL